MVSGREKQNRIDGKECDNVKVNVRKVTRKAKKRIMLKLPVL